jgi:hypothetical protein
MNDVIGNTLKQRMASLKESSQKVYLNEKDKCTQEDWIK